MEYKNPNLDSVTVNKAYAPRIPYVQIRLEAAWSIPEWRVFKSTFPELYRKIEEDFPGRTKDFQEAYSTYRYNNNMVSYEAYSGYGGYPEYVSASKKIKCSCCKEEAEFVFQLDSLEEYYIDWAQMTLYCYKCNNTGIHSFVLS